jgi:hypothetical protein
MLQNQIPFDREEDSRDGARYSVDNGEPFGVCPECVVVDHLLDHLEVLDADGRLRVWMLLPRLPCAFCGQWMENECIDCGDADEEGSNNLCPSKELRACAKA